MREKLPRLFSLFFRFRTIIKYLVSGGTAAVVDLVFLYFFTDTLGLWYLLSSVLAFLIAFGVSFSLQKFWTFRDHSTDRLYQQASVYLGVSFFGNLVVNTCLMYVFVDIFHIHYFLSQIITSGLIAIVSFFIYRNFVFLKKTGVEHKKLLFITQKIHQTDDDLAFVILWVKEFIRQGFEVQVICLEKGNFDDSFPVFSLGKEVGHGKIRRTLRFLKLIVALDYDCVFVHMNPEYFTLGGWLWLIKDTPMYLWYTHYTNHIHVKLAARLAKRMFAATAQSLPQYNKSSKKIVTGHGIDMKFWSANGNGAKFDGGGNSGKQLLTVHRLCRSKRLEIGVKALKYLPSDFTLTVYGRQVEKDYWAEIEKLVNDEKLQARFNYQGPVPMAELKEIYPHYRLMVNMASETIDKTMLEAMLFGIYPVTTKANSLAIGLPIYPENDSPEAVADFIRTGKWSGYDREFLKKIVEEKHSLIALIGKMGAYIKKGI